MVNYTTFEDFRQDYLELIDAIKINFGVQLDGSINVRIAKIILITPYIQNVCELEENDIFLNSYLVIMRAWKEKTSLSDCIKRGLPRFYCEAMKVLNISDIEELKKSVNTYKKEVLTMCELLTLLQDFLASLTLGKTSIANDI